MLIAGIILGLIALVIGVPIFAVFVLGAGLPLFYELDIPLSALSNLCVGAINKYVLLAIPLFILAGNLLMYGGAARRIIDFLMSLLRHVPGGMAIIAVIACAFFGACAGSSLAVIVAVGSIMIPMMEEYGYSRSFSSGLICVAALLGLVIPPSNGFIIYGAITGTSIAKLFIAGIVPGLLLALGLCTVAFFICRGRFEVMPRATWRERGKTFVVAIPSLCVPVVVLGGIYGGIFTPTEAAAVACAVALILGLIYRQLTWKSFMDSLARAARGIGLIFLLISTAIFLAAMFSYFEIPQAITTWVLSAGLSPIAFLLMTKVLVLVLGTFIEAVPMSYISLPITFPVAVALNIDPLQFGVLCMIGGGAGQVTPPVGVGLYTASAVSGSPIQEVLKEAIPFWLTWVLFALVFIFVPSFSTFLPGLI